MTNRTWESEFSMSNQEGRDLWLTPGGETEMAAYHFIEKSDILLLILVGKVPQPPRLACI